MLTSKLKCVRHEFVFNDGSEVTWYPEDQEGNQHQWFTVYFRLKRLDGGKNISHKIKGPASAKASLHHLKWVLKENQQNDQL